MTIQFPMDQSKVHLITVEGSKYALDVNSAIFFEIDDLVYDMLEIMVQVSNENQIVEHMAASYPRPEVLASLGELKRLITQGELFSGERSTGALTSKNDSAGIDLLKCRPRL